LGAQYWGTNESPQREPVPRVPGLQLGCFFDYAALDMMLRVAIVGPSGESEPCVNGLPGDGVSEVWIFGLDFEPADYYAEVAEPEALAFLLASLPVRGNGGVPVYGGEFATEPGYYGPALPELTEGEGMTILADTVSVRDGVVR